MAILRPRRDERRPPLVVMSAGGAGKIPIVEVAFDRLHIREEAASLRVEREQRVRVEVVARTQRVREIRSGIAGRHVQDAVRLVEGIAGPRRRRRSADSRVTPSARWHVPARVGDRVELPHHPTARGVQGVDPPGHPEVVAAGVSGEDEPVPRDRRHRRRLALLRVANRNVPELFPSAALMASTCASPVPRKSLPSL